MFGGVGLVGSEFQGLLGPASKQDVCCNRAHARYLRDRAVLYYHGDTILPADRGCTHGLAGHSASTVGPQ